MRIHWIAAGIVAALSMGSSADRAAAGVFISVSVAPPPLPVYNQPPIPGPDYIWTPGYWAWDDDVGDYYWVPGAWVPAPEPGLYWTPGYWGWRNGVYVWNVGYWAPHIGFYGGVNYGFGYTGVGFAGGYWSGGVFTYNKAVTNITNTTVVTNIYSKPVIANNTTRVSFNGGNGGVQARPTAEELAAAREPHRPATEHQLQHQKLASQNKELRASVNQGRPPIAAVSKAGDFSKGNTFAAKSAGGPLKPTSLTTTVGPNNKSLTNKNFSTGPGGNQNKSLNGLTGRNTMTNNSSGLNSNSGGNKNFGPPKGASIQKKPPPPPHDGGKKPPQAKQPPKQNNKT